MGMLSLLNNGTILAAWQVLHLLKLSSCFVPCSKFVTHALIQAAEVPFEGMAQQRLVSASSSNAGEAWTVPHTLAQASDHLPLWAPVLHTEVHPHQSATSAPIATAHAHGVCCWPMQHVAIPAPAVVGARHAGALVPAHMAAGCAAVPADKVLLQNPPCKDKGKLMAGRTPSQLPCQTAKRLAG